MDKGRLGATGELWNRGPACAGRVPGEEAAGAVVGTTTLAERIARTGDGRIRSLSLGAGSQGSVGRGHRGAEDGPRTGRPERVCRKGRGGRLRNFDGLVPAVLNAREKDENPLLWDLRECQCPRWIDGRVVLLGDAASGFLPTAGVGASMSMIGAAGLADELSRADADHLDCALGLLLFYRRTRPKTDAAQDSSRKLARFMTVESAALAWGRERPIHLHSRSGLARYR